ncbi:SGNH/GDSL hydrolase family protein [Roseobacter ponti]|uniref:VPLPA-CTERM sorting domain-containing protein n=1 Tax=Roseobacter ponti TaxID=1891787 RepID=A0A858SQH9_9RHOB|nr:SGNH/GDSL hydrolase family protein [Roseobacter ponti]QJF49921.1 VPLPA-CTERM sorting domain-containing protein [Roseobacter ponti]
MRKLLLSAACFAALGTAAPAASVFDAFTSFYATGDSLSDDGKLGDALKAPSVDGRFSNGPVWTEIIAENFAVDFNFALGGATAGDINATDYSAGGTVTDPQLSQLVSLSTFGNQAQVLSAFAGSSGDNPLVSVLFGANDIFQGLTAGTLTPEGVRAVAASIADGIRDIQTLGGAQFDDFAVANLPDIGAIPAFNLPVLAAQGELALLDATDAPADQVAAAQEALNSALANQAAASALTSIFNGALSTELDALRADASVYLIDQFTYFNDLLADPSRLGLLTGTLPCTFNLRADPAVGDCIVVGVNPVTGEPLVVEEIADLFLFIDPVHPNRIVQADFAEFAAGEIARQSVSPVPLPAGMPLMLAGLAGFGVIARRRKTARAAP